MRRLIVFNSVSADGYFTDAKGDMSWAHKTDAEWNAFTAENARAEGTLIFGRVTYEMMAGFWPTQQGKELAPTVAATMNNAPKVVFSKTLGQAAWNNTTLVKDDPAKAIRALKQGSGSDLVIMGSGTIVSQLSQARLIDEYQIVLNPIVLGKGRTMFEGMTNRMSLKRTKTRSFGNGNIVLWYEPVA